MQGGGWLIRVLDILNHLSNFGVLVPFCLGLWFWGRLTSPARIVVAYFGFWSVEAFVNLWSVYVLRTNIYLFHVSVLAETWLLGLAYYHVLRNSTVRRVLPFVGALFTLICLCDAFWWSGLSQLNTYARTAQVVVMLSLVLLYFEQWLQELRVTKPWSDFMFVVSVAQAIYYAGSFMPYLLQVTTRAISNTVSGLIIASTYLVALLMMTAALWRQAQAPVAPHLWRSS